MPTKKKKSATRVTHIDPVFTAYAPSTTHNKFLTDLKNFVPQNKGDRTKFLLGCAVLAKSVRDFSPATEKNLSLFSIASVMACAIQMLEADYPLEFDDDSIFIHLEQAEKAAVWAEGIFPNFYPQDCGEPDTDSVLI